MGVAALPIIAAGASPIFASNLVLMAGFVEMTADRA
jgi:hypothetical protein